MEKAKIIENCKKLIGAFKEGKLGQTRMPEDTHPNFENNEAKLSYFTLPMALNYQRDSYKLWESALKTYNDKETAEVFDIKSVSIMEKEKLRTLLMKHKLALQPNKHIETWQKIAQTVNTNFDSFENMMKNIQNDYLNLKELIQFKYKQGFPYLSGPKIFNYWSFKNLFFISAQPIPCMEN